mgnify:CR=1 FL=1
MFALVLFKGDFLTGIFTTDADVIQKGYDYLKGLHWRQLLPLYYLV